MPSAKFVAESLGLPGRLPGAGALAHFTSYCTDTRTLQPGALFIALKGELHDGHDHIASACAKGATGVVHEARPGLVLPPGVLGFEVKDSLKSFRALMAAWRNTFRIPVLMVAGSVGKTTTKEILAALLKGRFGEAILKTDLSQNGFVGIPMTLCRLDSNHRAAVIEVGIDDIGAMSEHWELVRPTSAIVTAIAAEHLEKLKDLETVTREEMLALEKTLAAAGKIFVNMDDPVIRNFRPQLSGAFIFEFTTEPSAIPGPTVLVGTMAPDGSIRVSGLGVSNAEFRLPLPGAHNARNFLGALAMALSEGLTVQEIQNGLAGFVPAEGRTNVRHLSNGAKILADYYNANPASMQAALTWLADEAEKTTPPKRRLALLGDMLELGPQEEALHRGLAPALQAAGVSEVFLYGPRMMWLQNELNAPGFRGIKCTHFESHEALAKAVNASVDGHAILLLKGSRGMKMETVLKFLGAK